MTAYAVELSDRAQEEAENAAFRLSARLGPERAARWYAGLLLEMEKLATMPRRFAVAEEESSAFPDMEIRRMLYGRGQAAYRILYHVLEPREGEVEGVVRVLRIQPGVQRPLGVRSDQEADEDVS